MAVILDEAGGQVLDEGGGVVYDEAGAGAGSAVYALQSFCFHNTATGADEFVIQGAQRDSSVSQAFAQTPASFWSASPLGGPQITGVLATYLTVYPAT